MESSSLQDKPEPSEESATVKPSALDNTLSLDYWQKRWNDAQTGWHQDDGNKSLWSNFNKIAALVFPNKEMKDLKVFVPLCGKSKDMYRFYQVGCTVVGVEFAPQAVKLFFEENSIPVNEETLGKGSKFTESADGRMIIGQGDLFTFTGDPETCENKLPFTKYDIIWDRGSLEAINEKDRSRYTSDMKALLADDGVYLIHVSEYDTSEYGGPPLAVTQEELRQFYGSEITIEPIETTDHLAEGEPRRQVFIDRGITAMTYTLYSMRKRC